jgi:hypothetical protein
MTTRERIIDLESRLAVEDLTVRKFGKQFQVYPWLKGRLFHKIITGKETNQARNVRLYFTQLGSLFYGLKNIFGRYDIWAFSNSLERRLIDGKYTDKLFDYIGNNSGKRMLLIETRIVHFYPLKNVASRHVVSRSLLMLFEELYAKLFLRKVHVNNPSLLNEILASVDGGVDHALLIRKYIAQYRVMSLVLKLFPNPRLVLLSVGYTHFGYIRAFKEKGIKVAEVQHGIISSNHHGYCYEKALDAIQFPDIVLTNGEREFDVFNEMNAFPTKNIRSVGSFIIEHYARSQSLKNSDMPRILFTLQDGTMGLKLLKFVLQLRDLAEGRFRILVQPRRTAKASYCVDLPECELLEFSQSDFYSTIKTCAVHSTVYSTTAIESLSLGVPNILINIEGQAEEQLSSVLGTNPFTKMVNTPEEFCEAFNMLIGAPSLDVMQSNTSCYTPGYKENISSFLKEMLDEH